MTFNEMQLELANYFNYRKNIILTNVSWGFFHKTNQEADMLILRPSGFVVEIELKRTWSDFLKELKKNHRNRANDQIRELYYAAQPKLAARMKLHIISGGVVNHQMKYAGVVSVSKGSCSVILRPKKNTYATYLTERERMDFTRLGCVKAWRWFRKITELENKLAENERC